MKNTICGTGHRPQHVQNFGTVKEDIKKFISENNVGKVISGMALGYDTILAEAVIELKEQGVNIILEAAVPCNNQDCKWLEKDRIKYKNILSKCDIVTLLQQEYTVDCLQKRNKYMVDNSDMVLAYWNGKQNGGTYNCIKYAESKHKKIINIYKEENIMKTAYSCKQLGYYLGQGEKDIECVFKLNTIDDVVFMYGVANNFNFYQKGKLFSPETIKQAAIKKLAELTKDNKVIRFTLVTYKNKQGVLVKKLKPWTMKCVTLRDMICDVHYEEFETTSLDDEAIDYECYSVVSQEGSKKTIRYKVYTVKPEFQGVVVETQQFNEVVKGVVINGKTCQPIVEKVKGLTFRVTTLDGRVVDVDYKKVRAAWEANRIKAANEAEAYRIKELGEEVSFEDKLAFVLINHNPIEIIDRNKIKSMMGKVLSLDLDANIKEAINESEFEEGTINAVFNYLGDIKLDTAEYVDREVVERLYEEVKPTYYGNANLLEAVIYNDEIL